MDSLPVTSIREGTRTDAAALALIGGATFLESFAGVLAGDAIVRQCAIVHTPEAYRRHLDGGGRAWLAEAMPGSAPIGFAMIGRPDLPAAQDGDIELKRIYTLSRFHGSGVGAALMAAVLRAASGSQRLLLGVYAGNTRAQTFYRKNGFEQIATRQFDVGGTLYDDIVYARLLAA